MYLSCLPERVPHQRIRLKTNHNAQKIAFMWIKTHLTCLRFVLQKFLLKIPTGVFGEESERRLLTVLELPTRMEQYDITHE